MTERHQAREGRQVEKQVNADTILMTTKKIHEK